ncbi:MULTISPECIES: acyltransferase [Psychrilyobacter]|uniref:Acyltransferase n=1 Tax=Psychrilyobacter piezotolerans TaxID=2293438 RepID=A0ABX9KDT9_9FUSO|nr:MULTISPECIES: acyltransferase [Psychrilyobacter]MCS5422121.1 acyltransferase [Psychrilyobacter sp. S5]NDI76282.1 acyltransferase [Psychrilyobacter piezotolerans]RDE59167.1 acyltransferase [Psychrilyobacter sp. S5]REI39729.1 acyltransferase [Psychrilyobacter piezotolerans]
MNIYRLRKIFLFIPDTIQRKLNPLKFAKRKGVNIKGNVKLYGRQNWGTEPWMITLGNNVYITNNVSFLTHDGGTLILRQYVPDLELSSPIAVGDDVYIGINSVILPGVSIGNNVIVAAGSVVTRDIPDNSVYGGVPAKFIKTVDEYFEKAKKNSLHLGHLSAIEKEKELKKLFSNQL